MADIVGDLDRMVTTMRYKAFFHNKDIGDKLLHKKVTPPTPYPVNLSGYKVKGQDPDPNHH